MLAEACRVLRGKGSTAHFWPVVAETDIFEPIELTEIRELVRKARKEVETKEQRKALQGFGLAVRETELLKLAFQLASDDLPTGMSHQSRSLVLTRKVA